MKIWDQIWESINENVLKPSVDHQNLSAKITELKGKLPIPVVWLLGKTQSGKTSIIRSLTGDSRAKIGDSIRPCTANSFLYNFPTAENSLIRFLDTRGLGEIQYDPTEDMELFSKQAHLLMVVIKVMDHAQQSVLETVRKIVARHPDWPLVVVQTALHEGYPSESFNHLTPYPYQQISQSEAIPQDLKRSLLKQREWFKDMNAHFVALDFTLPDDGYEPEFYGLDALWDTIENVFPLGLRSILKKMNHLRQDFQDIYLSTAQPHIIAYSVAAGGSGVIPIPFVGLPITAAIQAKMFQAIASIYNQELSRRLIGEISSALGMGVLSGLGGRELVKLVPVFGSAVSGLYTAATTYALGWTLCKYFSLAQDGDLPDAQTIQNIYKERLKEGRELLKNYMKNMNETSTKMLE